MPTTLHNPGIPSKDGTQSPKSIHKIVQGFWVPAFAGMSAMVIVACGSQTAEVPAKPEEALKPVPSRTLEDIDFKSYSKELAKFTGLAEGQSRGAAVDNIRLYFAPQDGRTIINTTQSKFEREDGAVLLFGASGMADDSIKAEEIYLIVQGPKGSQKLAAYGSRIKCHRGENTTEWQATPCP